MANTIKIKFMNPAKSKEEPIYEFSFQTNNTDFEILRHSESNHTKSLEYDGDIIYFPHKCNRGISREKKGELRYDRERGVWNFTLFTGETRKINNGEVLEYFNGDEGYQIFIFIQFCPQ